MKGVNDEICGGTHVKNTKDIQKFMISEYFSKGTGLWRIIGITSNSTVSSYIDQEIEKYKILIDKIKEQIDEYKIKDKQLDSFFHEISYHSSCKNLIKLKTEYSKLKIYFDELLNETIKDMNKKSIVDIKLSPKLFSKNNNLMYFSVFEQNQKNIISALKELQNENSNLIFICFNIFPNKIQYIINCKPDSSIKANELIKKINIISNGNGGGDMFFAQGGSDKKDSLSDIIQLISDY
ncbi:MAG: hypothetical protein LBB39_00015 [Mycoplasmataceae bacterium]|nr:hypothetical protein [Mycoplasmataceae bacterium]